MRTPLTCSAAVMHLLAAVFSVGAAFLFSAALSSPANAVSVTTSCYGATPNFSLTTDPGSTCVGTGTPQNDINNGVPASFPAGYVLLDKSDDAVSGVAGWLTAISFTGGSSGTFTITPGAGYNLTTLILAFKDGTLPDPPGPPTDPGYGAFILNGALSGDWAILFDHDVSHFTLYGQSCGPAGAGCAPPPGEVPIPGALPLFTSGIGLLSFLGWRRKKRMARQPG